MTEPDGASGPKASTLLNRRGQRAIVRAADPARRRETYSQLPPGVARDRRRRIPTLIGLGDELPRDTLPETREWMPTMSGLGERRPDVTLPDRGLLIRTSGEDAPEQTPRPVTLAGGIDDELAAAYRDEAARILTSGIYPVERSGDRDACEEEPAIAGSKLA